jgi:succinate dehydrogenase hydrophobic anchor subunit
MRTLQLLTAIVFAIFWTLYFTIGFANEAYPTCYESFENSFPIPDLFIIILLVLAWWNGNKNPIKAEQFTRIAGGAMIFLGLCDSSFNMMNGMYQINNSELLMNAAINLWCIGFGAWQAFSKSIIKEQPALA